MTIGSCTSCQSSGEYIQAARERQNVNRNNDIANDQAYRLERQQVQENFTPNPSRILDIQA